MFILSGHRFYLLYYLAAIILSCFTCSTSLQKLDPDERAALGDIMKTMGATSFVLPDGYPWNLTINTGRPISTNTSTTVKCYCMNDTCHITELRIKSYSLSGVLPPQLAQLKYLQTLDVTRNYLNGTIPKEWVSLKNLTFISLTANRLSGEIPSYLGNITSLNYLSLEANQFNGTIPPEIGNLTNLQTLILSSNQLGGQVPKELAQLHLRDFRLNDNQFNDTIPEFIANWKNLTKLQLFGTGLKGPIPPAIFNLENLSDIRITDINESELQLSNVKRGMQTLILRNVNLSGQIPEGIWNLADSSLTMLDLTFNKLEGTLPSGVSLPQFTLLSGNMLSGIVPNSFVQSNNRALDLSYNNLSWPSNCQYTHANTYRSSSSNDTLAPCSGISSCSKYYDSFHINCGGETVRYNNSYGWLLYEGDGNVVGGAGTNYLSDSNWGFSSTGEYMADQSAYDNRYTLAAKKDLSMDYSELYTSARIAPLSLTYYGYCLRNGNYNVKLHFAEIQFTDDEEYLTLGTRVFDIYVQGKLVQRDFNIKKEASGPYRSFVLPINATVTDNTLEIRLYWAGKGTTCIPQRGNYGPLISAVSVCSSDRAHCEENSKSSKVALVVGVVVSTLCVVILAMGFICWRFYLRDKCFRGRDLKGLDLPIGSFTLKQLKAATKNFDSNNKLGEGGFGVVYKGELSDGTCTAVKQLSSKSMQGNREFVNEIGLISGLQHPNLVKLYGCCIEGNHLLLVYEYMENNNLAHALFATKRDSRALMLDWNTRQKICVGIAKGLTFLHEESTLRIVHRDIKATNVLLDKDLNAKISDFGLAKLHEEGKSHISTRVAGTIGYMAPEYASWGYLTEKADVYSFGVLTLEIVSGISNSNYKPEDKCACLLDWAFELQANEKIEDIVDPELRSEFNKEEAIRMAEIALVCTNVTPSLRPTMSEVVRMLLGQCPVSRVISDNDVNNYSLRGVRPHKGQRSSSCEAASVISDKSYTGTSSSSVQILSSLEVESVKRETTEELSLL